MNTAFLIIGIILILIVLSCIIFYNRFVTLRNRVADQRAQIGVQLKRRYDLIPNLVETVRRYTDHESEVFTAVTAAHAAAIKSDDADSELTANAALTGSLHRLLALGESYPDLKSNQNFLHLQQELVETENKIAMARQFYNDSILLYNTALQRFPGNLAAHIMHFKPMNFPEIPESETQRVDISKL